MSQIIPFNKDSDDLAFARFLASGELGPLVIGLSEAEVLTALGEPLKVGKPLDTDPVPVLSLFYSHCTMAFANGRLVMYEIDCLDPEGEPPAPLGATWYRVVRTVGEDTMVKYLKDHAIHCQYVVNPFAEDDTGYIFLPSSRVSAVYSGPGDNELQSNLIEIIVSEASPKNQITRDC